MPVSDTQTLTRDRIRQLRKRAADLGLRHDEIQALFLMDPSRPSYATFTRTLKAKILIRHFLAPWRSWCHPCLLSKRALCALLTLTLIYWMRGAGQWDLRSALQEAMEERCILDLPEYVPEIVRPQVPCELCRGLHRFPVVYNISQEDFTTSYAYTGIPVLIKGATTDWGALHSFDFRYFRRLYQNSTKALRHVERECQFFPYQTEFETLAQVFNMAEDRADLKEGTRPWYIGWSNCDVTSSQVGARLRGQYSRPYFLPSHSSNMDTDWIFMGGPGFGSGMHIDFVERPSWQAQVSGSKTWILDPSPECWGVCQRLEVTVEKGDIIVVDTNIWYHSTRVNPGNISITIGAEYD